MNKTLVKFISMCEMKSLIHHTAVEITNTKITVKQNCQGILFSGLRWTGLVVYHCVYIGVL